tara:strand:+ start:88 stop:1248 length:1161 start_codon:yes stop_codon:yes gene_type:complete
MSEIKVNSVKGVGASTAAITINNSDGTCTANVTNNLGNKNFIINGGHEVAQRGSAQVIVDTTVGYRSVDRFKTDIDNATGRWSHGQSTDVPANLGFRNSSKILVTTTQSQPSGSDVANQFYYMMEKQDVTVLRWGSANAKTCTLSFYVKGSKDGTYPLWLQWYGSSDNYFYYTSYTIDTPNTWERKTITITGPTSGGQSATDPQNTGLRIEWGLGYGSDTETGTLNEWTTSTTKRTPAGAVYLPENAGATWFITGCQFEISPVATEFERCPFSKALEYCQRYYERVDYGGDSMSGGLAGFYNKATEVFIIHHFRVVKRSTPTLEYSALSHLDLEPHDSSVSNVSVHVADTRYIALELDPVTSKTQGHACYLTIDTSGGYIAFYSEM